MNAETKYKDLIEPLVDKYKKGEIDIKQVLPVIIPIFKDANKYLEKNEDCNDPYVLGMQEAYINNPGINVRTVNTQMINSFFYDINDYVNFHLRKG
jgi:hypothetical protein